MNENLNYFMFVPLKDLCVNNGPKNGSLKIFMVQLLNNLEIKIIHCGRFFLIYCMISSQKILTFITSENFPPQYFTTTS
jgi:hypothetical protein